MCWPNLPPRLTRRVRGGPPIRYGGVYRKAPAQRTNRDRPSLTGLIAQQPPKGGRNPVQYDTRLKQDEEGILR